MEELYELKAKKRLLESEIDIRLSEIKKIDDEIFEKEYMLISWDDLEKFLKDNRPENDRDNNPAVWPLSLNWNRGAYSSYCKLNEKGELQIGAYYYNDSFPRGEEVYIRKDFKSYR